MALLVAGLTTNGRIETRIAQGSILRAQIDATADGAVQLALFHILATGEGRWRADGTTRRIAADDHVDLLVRVDAEDGLLNPSVTAPPIFAAALIQCGQSAQTANQIANAIMNWHIPDENGQVTDAYRQAGRPYAPSGHAFYSLADFQYVLGMTAPVLRCLEPHLSFTQTRQASHRTRDGFVAAALRAGLSGTDAMAPDTSPHPGAASRENDARDIVIDVIARRGAARVERRVTLSITPENPVNPYSIRRWTAPPAPSATEPTLPLGSP